MDRKFVWAVSRSVEDCLPRLFNGLFGSSLVDFDFVTKMAYEEIPTCKVALRSDLSLGETARHPMSAMADPICPTRVSSRVSYSNFATSNSQNRQGELRRLFSRSCFRGKIEMNRPRSHCIVDALGQAKPTIAQCCSS